MADLVAPRWPARRSFRAFAVGGSLAAHALIVAWLLLSAHAQFHLPAGAPVQVSLAPRWLFEPARTVRRPHAPQAPRKPRRAGAGPAAAVAAPSPAAERPASPATLAALTPTPAGAAAAGPNPGAIAALRNILGSMGCKSPGTRLTPEQRARCKPMQADPAAPAFHFQGPKIEAWDRELAERHAPAKEPFVPCPLDMPGSNFGLACQNTPNGPRQ